MEFYFSDRGFNIVGMASTDLPDAIRIYNDIETSDIESGLSSFEGKIYFTDDADGNIEIVKEMCQKGNYILYKNRFGEDKFYTIIDTEKDRKENSIEFYAEDGGLDLINEVVGPYEADKAYPVSFYINKFLTDSGFVLGLNEISNLSRKLKWEGEASVTSRLRSVATQFDNSEIGFSFEINGMNISKKVLNIYKKRGKDVNKTLTLGQEVNNIKTIESIENLATSLFPTGGTPEGKDAKPINLAGYKYDDGRFFVSKEGFVRDRESRALWNRFKTTPNNETGYINKTFSYDTKDKKELLNRTIGQLKKVSQPDLNFIVDIVDFPDGVALGDRINIVDEADDLYLSTRVLQLEIEEGEDRCTALLGEFIIRQKTIDEKLYELAANIKDTIPPGDTYYPSVAYADDDQGNGFSLKPTGKSYMAIIYQMNNSIPSEDKNDYFGQWIEIKGGQGIPGSDGTTKYMWVKYAYDELGAGISDIPGDRKFIGIAYNKDEPKGSINPKDYTWSKYEGPKGEDAKPKYMWIKYADDIFGNGMSDEPTGKLYMGFAYNKETEIESNDPKDYEWSKYAGLDGKPGQDGVDGEQGPRGEQGIPGVKGEDGKTQYTHIAYANSADGVTDFSLGDSNRKYIGMYVDFEIKDSSDPKKYAWSLIKGADGTNGTPGKPGADGKTPYFHTAWAMSDDGKIGFSTTVSTGKTHLGTYTDFTQADSTDPTKYSWSLIKGPQGNAGKDGSDGKPGKDGLNGKTTFFHTAWSNSEDGSEDFSTSYPNYNTYSNEKTVISGIGTGQVSGLLRNTKDAPNGFQVTGHKDSDAGLRLQNVITSNGWWTISFYVRGSQNVAVRFSLDICDLEGEIISTTTDNSWKKVTKTVKVTNYSNTFNFVDFNHFAWAYFFIKDIKVENYESATPFVKYGEKPIMRYMGTYSDYEEKDSEDYKRYKWARFLGEEQYNHYAWANSADGKTDFTTELLSPNLFSIRQWNLEKQPNKTVTEVQEYSLRVGPNKRFYVSTGIAPEGLNANVFAYPGAGTPATPTNGIVPNQGRIVDSGTAQTITIGIRTTNPDLDKNWVMMTELLTPQKFIPSEKDDYFAANHQYIGVYSSGIKEKSTNPADYQWTRVGYDDTTIIGGVNKVFPSNVFIDGTPTNIEASRLDYYGVNLKSGTDKLGFGLDNSDGIYFNEDEVGRKKTFSFRLQINEGKVTSLSGNLKVLQNQKVYLNGVYYGGALSKEPLILPGGKIHRVSITGIVIDSKKFEDGTIYIEPNKSIGYVEKYDLSIDQIQLEDGDKFTSFGPNPDLTMTRDEWQQAQQEIDDKLNDKANNQDMMELQELLDKLNESYQGFVSEGGQYEQDLKEMEKRTVGMVNELGAQVSLMKFLTTYIRMGEEGLLIGKEGDPMQMLLSRDKLSFTDGGQVVAYFSNQSFFINKGAVVESLQVGNHKMTKLDNESTIFQYVGK